MSSVAWISSCLIEANCKQTPSCSIKPDLRLLVEAGKFKLLQKGCFKKILNGYHKIMRLFIVHFLLFSPFFTYKNPPNGGSVNLCPLSTAARIWQELHGPDHQETRVSRQNLERFRRERRFAEAVGEGARCCLKSVVFGVWRVLGEEVRDGFSE